MKEAQNSILEKMAFRIVQYYCNSFLYSTIFGPSLTMVCIVSNIELSLQALKNVEKVEKIFNNLSLVYTCKL